VGELFLFHGDKSSLQWVDYWSMSFRCFTYHKIGHVQDNCTKASFPFFHNHKTWVKNGTKESIDVKISLENSSARKDFGMKVSPSNG
jgi:hypothetical protein